MSETPALYVVKGTQKGQDGTDGPYILWRLEPDGWWPRSFDSLDELQKALDSGMARGLPFVVTKKLMARFKE